MSDTSARTMYRDGTYLANNPGWHDEDGAWKARHVLSMLRANGIEPRSVCDVGCGTGRVLDELSRHLPAETTFDGFDVVPEPVAVGQARGNDRVRLHVGDAREDATSYDLLLMMDVFEHVTDYMGFLASFTGKARHFVFHIPLDLSVSTVARMSPLTRGREGIGHLHYFSRETALATLRDTGYDVVDEAYTAGGLELPARTLRRKAAKLPRRIGSKLSPHLTARVIGGFSLLVLAERRRA